MAGTCLHSLCLPLGGCCSPSARIEPGGDTRFPVTFGLILRDTHVHVFRGGSGGHKETGCPGQFSRLPSSSSFVKAGSHASPLSPQALAIALEQQAVRHW